VETRQALDRPTQSAKADARQGKGWVAALARAGLLAKGVSYGLVGVLAILVATGSGGQTTSREGALATLAQQSLGSAVLAVVAFGFAGYTIWQLVSAALGSDEESTIKEWAERAAAVGRAAIYGALTYATVRILLGASGDRSDNDEARQASATVLSWPGGSWLVGAAGLAVAAFGAWNVYRGLGKKFEDDWQAGRLSARARRWGRAAGVGGHVARGVVFGLVGVFLVKAAVDYDPRDAIGLDGALEKVANAGYGPYLLGVVAVGLVAYGVFCLVDAWLRDVSVG
jgi:hypothetical protein